jgi:peptide-methionine (S)-S-oxide reductase
MEEEPGKISRIATFCAGSFWDIEPVFRHVSGVIATSVGFMGGTVPSPAYEEVCTGTTGHSEVVMVAYNPSMISYREILGIFFNSHDPCAREQGEYAGVQYEPVIYCHSEQDRQQAREYVSKLQHQGRCPREIVTRIVPSSEFYRAEECHQQFYEKMGNCYPALHTRDRVENV